MNLLFLGALAVLIFLLSARWLANTEPRNVKIAGGLSLAVILVVLALLMALTGRVLVSVPLLMGAFAAYRRYRRLVSMASYLGGMAANRKGSMSREEALRVLGLEEGAGTDQINAAHRTLMQKLHPDHGGTDYLAAKLNEAREVLKSR